MILDPMQLESNLKMDRLNHRPSMIEEGSVQYREPPNHSIGLRNRSNKYRMLVLFITFWAYTSYHLSRKPISVVKSVLGGTHNCSQNGSHVANDSHCTGWAPFNGKNSNELLGALDYSFLFAYAFGIFVSGHIAERMDLRHFLTIGMTLSGICTAMFGVGFYLNMHQLWYYIIVMVIVGLFQSTGWPAIVACVANWFGKGKRGLIMGIWNCHTSVGNILGAVIAGVFVESAWGLSFIVPGAIIFFMGIVVFLFLVPKPSDVGCVPPDHVVVTEQAPPATINDRPSDYDSTSSNEDYFTSGESDPLVYTAVKETPRPRGDSDARAISFLDAVKIPGVLEFSFCLFFAKLVSYTFLFWLPDYIKNTTSFDAKESANLSTVFDFGGALGGIMTGLISDITGGRGTTCMIMLSIAAPMMFLYEAFGAQSLAVSITLLFVTGMFVNGPYALITTAVSADLGTHPSLDGNKAALATVTAIIDGTGSIGAALGPLFTSVISQRYGWNSVFYMLICADCCALLLLVRVVYKEIRNWTRPHTIVVTTNA